MLVNLASWSGPKYNNIKFISVKLLVITYPSFSCHPINLKTLNKFITNLPIKFKSEYRKIVVLISSLSVFELNFGNRCLGHGINLNNCGEEYKKLKT